MKIEHRQLTRRAAIGASVKSRSSEEERERLLEAGWESRLRGGLIVWRRPGGRGRWYNQRVAMELLQFLEEEKNQKDVST